MSDQHLTRPEEEPELKNGIPKYGIMKSKFSLHYIILISLVLQFPRCYIYFSLFLKKCKIEVSLCRED
jgi:hypothetical protein